MRVYDDPGELLCDPRKSICLAEKGDLEDSLRLVSLVFVARKDGNSQSSP